MRGPTQQSLKLLRDRGAKPFGVEWYNPWAKRRTDLYHFIDIVALEPTVMGLLGVQTTTGGHFQERIRKAEGISEYWDWLMCGNDVEFHGWRKLKGRWVPRINRVSLKDLL